MNRPITTRMHGVIDYSWATTAAALSKVMDGAPATARLVRSAAYAGTMSSTMTNYEAGVLRLVPMKGHLALDLLIGAALLAAPLFMPRSERRWAAAPVALGAVGLVAALLTQTRSPREIGDGRGAA